MNKFEILKPTKLFYQKVAQEKQWKIDRLGKRISELEKENDELVTIIRKLDERLVKIKEIANG